MHNAVTIGLPAVFLCQRGKYPRVGFHQAARLQQLRIFNQLIACGDDSHQRFAVHPNAGDAACQQSAQINGPYFMPGRQNQISGYNAFPYSAHMLPGICRRNNRNRSIRMLQHLLNHNHRIKRGCNCSARIHIYKVLLRLQTQGRCFCSRKGMLRHYRNAVHSSCIIYRVTKTGKHRLVCDASHCIQYRQFLCFSLQLAQRLQIILQRLLIIMIFNIGISFHVSHLIRLLQHMDQNLLSLLQPFLMGLHNNIAIALAQQMNHA